MSAFKNWGVLAVFNCEPLKREATVRDAEDHIVVSCVEHGETVNTQKFGPVPATGMGEDPEQAKHDACDFGLSWATGALDHGEVLTADWNKGLVQ